MTHSLQTFVIALIFFRMDFNIFIHWPYTHGTTQLIYAMVYPAMTVAAMICFFGVSFQTASTGT